MFVVGDHALTKDQHVIYDKAKGILYWDEDGSGAKAAVQLATLPKKLLMTAAEFFVI